MKNKLKDFYFEKENMIKKAIKITTLVLIIIAIITLVVIYFNEQKFRKWVDINILRNVDGTAFAFFSIIPINQNIGMIKGVRNVDHNEYRIEFINRNIELPAVVKKEKSKLNFLCVETEKGLSLVTHDNGKLVTTKNE